MSFVIMFGVLSVVPKQADACIKALGFLDPVCLIKNGPELPQLPGLPNFDSDDSPQTVNNTYTNSNNVNSNVNSTVSTNTGSHPAPVVAYATPVYNYNYDYNYNQYPQDNYGQLQVSCYPMPLSARTGDTVSWVASAYGGNNSYNYSWSGTDGLSGYGSAVSKTYYSPGYKNASVTVRSGNQTVSKNCDGTTNIYGDVYYNNSNYGYNYPQLYVSCSASSVYTNNNSAVTWNAYPSGGNGYYSYSWTGTDGLYGTGQSVYRNYPNAGQKYASVTVYSNGQSVTQNCGTVNVGGYGYVPVYNTNSGLDVACYSDPTTARINQPATWRAEVTGGVAPYTYSWTGSSGLSGSDSAIIKYYDTVGEKSAIVTIRSADGKTATRACSTSLTVRGTAVTAPAAPAQPVVQPDKDQNDNGLSAAALFSLENVPWGWVAILIILVLFATVVYLIFNRPKI
jgi:hypothetical protein